MVLRPVGPLSPGVYWFRRLLVLLLALAVAWLGWRWLGPGDDGGASAGPTPTPTVTSSTPSPTPTPTPTPTKKPSKTTGPTTSPALPTCANGDVTVAVSTDAETYPTGVEPRFTLSVTNESKQPCLRDLGPAALELRVSSGGARIWSSDDCSSNTGSEPTQLAPGTPFTETVSWARQSSQPGCPSGEPAADPGTYQVIARNLGLISDPAVFTLE